MNENTVSANAFRAKRLAWFLPLVDAALAERSRCRVLDIGGEIAYWRGLEEIWGGRPIDLTVVNIHEAPGSTEGYAYVRGDARDLRCFEDRQFDVVHSNSVVEHVGAWSDMQAMAREVRRLAPAYFVQTPNFWFPLEPHLRVPFIHWIPHPWRRSIVRSRACGFYPRATDVAAAETILQDASLLDRTAFAALFPDASIRRERIGPLTKSLIAVRHA